MVLMGTEVVPMLKKKSAQKPKKNAQNTANQNSTQIGVGRLSVVEGLIAAILASVVVIGVVIPAVSKVSNETLNSTSVNPMLGPMINLAPLLVITVAIVAIVALVSGAGGE
jgi:hypothetical protein